MEHEMRHKFIVRPSTSRLGQMKTFYVKFLVEEFLILVEKMV